MKRIVLSLLFLNAVQSADVVTVDPAGVTTVAGTAPATAPGAGEVKIGGGQISTAGNVNVNGAVYAKDIIVGTGAHAENHKLILWGPNTPAGEGSRQALSFEFVSAGSAQVRAYRGGSWDTYLEFLTNSSLNGSSTTPAVRMHISENGNVGIGTTNPSNKLTVAGDISTSGVIINGNAPGQAGGIAMLDATGKVPANTLPEEAKSGIICFTTVGTTTWTVPAGWSACKVTVIGAGSSGYFVAAVPPSIGWAGNPAMSVGGPSGGFGEHVISVTPGQVLNIVVGAGGVGGNLTAPNHGGVTKVYAGPQYPISQQLGGEASGALLLVTTVAGRGGGAVSRTQGTGNYASVPVGNYGAAGGHGFGPGGAEVPAGQPGLPGVLGGGGSGPSSANISGSGGNGCVMIQKLNITFNP